MKQSEHFMIGRWIDYTDSWRNKKIEDKIKCKLSFHLFQALHQSELDGSILEKIMLNLIKILPCDLHFSITIILLPDKRGIRSNPSNHLWLRV